MKRNAFVHAAGLYAMALIIIGVDAYVINHWRDFTPWPWAGFIQFSGAVLVIAIIAMRNLTWRVNIAVIIAAFVTFCAFYALMPF